MKRLSIKKSNAYADFIKSHIISKANKDTIIPTIQVSKVDRIIYLKKILIHFINYITNMYLKMVAKNIW